MYWTNPGFKLLLIIQLFTQTPSKSGIHSTSHDWPKKKKSEAPLEIFGQNDQAGKIESLPFFLNQVKGVTLIAVCYACSIHSWLQVANRYGSLPASI